VLIICGSDKAASFPNQTNLPISESSEKDRKPRWIVIFYSGITRHPQSVHVVLWENCYGDISIKAC